MGNYKLVVGQLHLIRLGQMAVGVHGRKPFKGNDQFFYSMLALDQEAGMRQSCLDHGSHPRRLLQKRGCITVESRLPGCDQRLSGYNATMNIKRLIVLCTLLAVMLFFTACGSEAEETEGTGRESPTAAAPTAPAPAATASTVETAAEELEEVEATPAVQVVDSPEGIVGTWRFTSDKFNQYFEDGTWYHARSLHILEYRIDTSGEGYGEYWFEDGLHYVTSDICIAEGFAEAGVYEIQEDEDDRVKFVLVEDPCWARMSWLTRASGRRVTDDEKS